MILSLILDIVMIIGCALLAGTVLFCIGMFAFGIYFFMWHIFKLTKRSSWKGIALTAVSFSLCGFVYSLF